MQKVNAFALYLDSRYKLNLGGEIKMIKTIADKNILKKLKEAEAKNIEIMKNFC
jgi:hypothetical protein